MSPGSRRRFRLGAVMLLALAAPAAAQPVVDPVAQAVARRWADAPADSAALHELLAASWQAGGATVMRGLLRAAADPERPYEVRLHALAGLAEFMTPDAGLGSLASFRAAASRAIPGCRPSTAWSPGDTIRSCAYPTVTYRRSVPTRPGPASTIAPAFRDTIRAVVHALAADEPDPRIRGIAAAFWRSIGTTERWSESTARRCRSLLARADSAAVPFDSPQVYGWYRDCEQTGPAVLARAWRSVPADSAHVVWLMRASQHARDRRVQAALQEVAADRTRPALVRQAALSALAALGFGWMQVYAVRPLGEGCGARSNDPQEEGGEPMGADAGADIRGFLRDLHHALGEADPVGAHAAHLARCIFASGREYRP